MLNSPADLHPYISGTSEQSHSPHKLGYNILIESIYATMIYDLLSRSGFFLLGTFLFVLPHYFNPFIHASTFDNFRIIVRNLCKDCYLLILAGTTFCVILFYVAYANFHIWRLKWKRWILHKKLAAQLSKNIRNMRREQNGLKHELSALQPNNPEVRLLKQQIKRIEKDMRTTFIDLVRDYGQRVITELDLPYDLATRNPATEAPNTS